MNFPEFGVRRPITNLMIFSAIIILSLYSLTRLGIDMMPEIEPPSISVISAYPGAGPEDVETKVTEVLENQLSTTPGLEKISSRSLEGISAITLKFVWGTNLDEATNDIRDRIERAKRFLPDIPDEMDNPFIFKFNTALIPILFVGITAEESYPQLYDLVNNRIGDALRQLPGVGTVQLQGAAERQINIWVDKVRLEGYGFSILDIQEALKRENVTQPVGTLKSGLTDYLIRLPGEFAAPAEINSIILGKRSSGLVYLKDVARVEDSAKEVTSIVRIMRKRGMIMMVQKQFGTNTVQVAERVKNRLSTLKNTLPGDVNINVILDNSRDIINSLDSLKSTVWVGAILVILVVWFFLRQMIPSLIIALTIPFSLLIAFIYLFLSGRTINTVSLSSLTIAVGMVVDNAIVVVDNIYRHLERGQRPQEAAVFGTSEMFLAVAASTLTTIAVFLPMLFIRGIVGIMFGEMAVIVTVTLLASLFTATTFSPMLSSQWFKNNRQKNNHTPGNSLTKKISDFAEKNFVTWEKIYSQGLAWCLGHKKRIILGCTLVFIASLFFIRFIGNEFIPLQDSGDLRINVSLPIGTRLEETDKVAKRVEDLVEKHVPEARFVYVRSGIVSGIGASFGQASGTHITSDGIKLIPKTKRKRSDMEIGQFIRAEVRKIPGVLKTDISTGNPISRIITGVSGKNIQLEIIGHSFTETEALAVQIKEIMENIPGAVDVSISRELKRPELKISIDREKASSLGLNMRVIADTIKTCIEGSTATKYREKGETYDIFVRLEENFRSKPEDIENLSIVSPFTNKQIKLGNIAQVYETAGPVEIERKNQERVVRVECNTYQRSIGKVRDDIKAQLQKITIPADIRVNFGGEAEEQAKAFRDLILLICLGICLVYMIMAAQFESLLNPFIIMFAMPFTFTGVIIALCITRTNLSSITMLGIVMLMGIVVNNAIVLISYIDILRARGLSLFEAITIGGKERLRPVLMTTITTLVGLLPLAMSRGEGSELWQPLGITMIGGLSVSTFITMFFVPTLYAIFAGRKNINDYSPCLNGTADGDVAPLGRQTD